MRLWMAAQVLFCVACGGFIASFVWAGFAPEHPAVLTFSRMSAGSIALAVLAAAGALVVLTVRALIARLGRGRHHPPAVPTR